MSNSEHVNPFKLRHGPVRHDTLSQGMLEIIDEIHQFFEPHFGVTLEEFEIWFMRHEHPEKQVSTWLGLASVWIDYHEQCLGGNELPIEDEKTLFDALVAISNGVHDARAFDIPEDIAAQLLSFYVELEADGG